MGENEITIIAAMDKNNLIGYQNHIPWKLPEDLAYFRKVTMGHPVVMGRRTYESLGSPLDGRSNIVLTHRKDLYIPGCIILNTIEEIVTSLQSKSFFVIGGAEVFKEFLPFATRLQLTRIDHEFIGDTYFPPIDYSDWTSLSYSSQQSHESPYFHYSYELWGRKK